MKLINKLQQLIPEYKLTSAPPLGSYVPIKEAGSLIYISGQLPFEGQSLITGKVPNETSIDDAVKASRICILNTLTIILNYNPEISINDLSCVNISGFVNSSDNFSEHPIIINGASDFLYDVLGEQGKHSRIAIGCNSLPKNASVEISSIFQIKL